MKIILYRAMSEKEFQRTMRYKELHYISKCKWFSPSLDFIVNRVMDGKFNNSKFVPDRYKRLVKFVMDKKYLVHFSKAGRKEVALRVRNYHNVVFDRIEEVRIGQK